MFQRIVCGFPSSIVAVSFFSLTACGGPEPMVPQPLTEASQQSHQGLQLVIGQGDLAFLETAASMAVGQIEMGQLALARSSSPMVHDYAAYMVNYAASVQQRASSIATAKGNYVSSDLGLRDSYHLLRLENLHGQAFDDKYINYQRAGLERSTYDAQDGFAASIDGDVRGLAARLAQDLPEIGQLVEYVDLRRGSVGDVPGALDSVINAPSPSKVPGKGPTGSQQEPGKAPTGSQQDPGQVPSQAPASTGSSSQQDSGKAPTSSQQAPGQVPSQGSQQAPASTDSSQQAPASTGEQGPQLPSKG